MKKIIFTLGLIAAAMGVFAQDGGSPMNKAVNRATHSRDFLMIQLAYDGWSGAPDNVKTGFNRGFNVALMYDVPLKNSPISLAAGLGVSTSGVFLKDNIMDISGKSNRNTASFPANNNAYKKFKVATTYVELPIEIRYRSVPDNANKGFKAAIGMKIGALVDAHTKGKNTGANGSKNIDKVANKGFFNPWRFAATARVGYGNFAVFGAYSLNTLLKDNNNIDIRPYQIGICISGL
ncbi:porin family protein [Chitinophaga nivalis]|uniref:PorT family protein n=1 Tax=Chitinophaga nivalis TaxID=2991709 RepID=A0ABT3IUT8_9BACT|nr:porin family protein [Chitinophaga nivalis]MCW3462571.1 PorT family protein [Chitinophaga nivalis]MCW3487738.1 PorT family protein [Chitinophaga nivalis]